MADNDFIESRWTSKDYVDSCYRLNPSNEIFQMSHLLMSVGASISTVSRYSSGATGCFSSRALVDYINGSSLAMMGISATRALELYRLFLETGFSKDFINQRYLIDYVNRECEINGM